MIEAIANPYYFFAIVLISILFATWQKSKALPVIRQIAFLSINIWILGWVWGTLKGILLYIGWATITYGAIQFLGPKRKYSKWFCAGLIALWASSLLTVKYVLPTFAGGFRIPPLGHLEVHQIWSTLNLSFLTFRMIHLVIDTHDGLISKVKFLPFFNYVFFVPTSISGPIQKYNQFENEILEGTPLTESSFLQSLRRLVKGLAKKVLVASLLTPYVLGYMEPFGPYPLLVLLLSCILFSIYIYMDFSGYSDIAIGGAGLVGMKLPENFNRPYLAVNLQDFWNRWHITFSEWLRTYLFYPINKWLVQRYPQHARKLNPVIALLITFAIAGIWHGNTWNFLVFGLMHGIGLAFVFLIRGKKREEPVGVKAFLARILTLSYVSISWIPFVYPLAEIPWLFEQALPYQIFN